MACRLLIAVPLFVAKDGAFGHAALVDVAFSRCGLSSCGSQTAARRHRASSLTRDLVGIPCIAKQILDHWTTTEVGCASLTLGFLSAYFEAWPFPFPPTLLIPKTLSCPGEAQNQLCALQVSVESPDLTLDPVLQPASPLREPGHTPSLLPGIRASGLAVLADGTLFPSPAIPGLP